MKKIKLSTFQIIMLTLIVIAAALWVSIIFTEPGTNILGSRNSTVAKV